MPVSKDLFLSILAMDAYNQGYNSGLDSENNNKGLGGNGSKVGWAEVRAQDGEQDAQDASFFAQSYTISGATGDLAALNGKSIISYRSTDQAADANNRYDITFGSYNGPAVMGCA